MSDSESITDSKSCKRCGETKPLEEFGRNSSTKDGKHRECKKCICERAKDYAANNKEKVSATKAKYRQANRDKFLVYGERYRARRAEKLSLWNEARKAERAAKRKPAEDFRGDLYKNLTQEFLRDLFDYNKETGAFVWKIARSHKTKVGEQAGSVGLNGYRSIRLGKQVFLVHRLVFLYVTGQWPSDCVDHINGDRTDNRWNNLRNASPAENLQNIKTPKTNTSGLIGATWNKRLGKWHAQIRSKNKRYHIGFFDTKEEANAAYLAAKAELHQFNPGVRE